MMKCPREVFKFLLMGLLVSSGLGEETGAGDPAAASIFQLAELEPAPSAWILDRARLFDEGEIVQLSARLEDFHSRFNIQIFVVAYSVLIGETIEDRARRLRGSWLADGSGIIVGYERGSDRMAFSATGDPLNTILKPELEFLIADAYEAAAQHQGAAERVRAAVDLLLAELPGDIERWQSAGIAAESEARTFLIWALGLLVLFTALGMFGFHFASRAEMQLSKSYTFPQIEVAERFGAPYCGGHQAEIRFTVPSK